MYINKQFEIGDIVTFKNPESDYFKKLLWNSFDYSINPAYCIKTFLKGNFVVTSIIHAKLNTTKCAYALKPCNYAEPYKFSQCFAFFEDDLKIVEIKKSRGTIIHKWVDCLNIINNKEGIK